MNFEKAVKILNSFGKTTIHLGLSRIEEILKKLGNPQEKLKIIHVAGTNGKGSTSTMISYILKENSLKTGLFTSPYITNVCEQIQINNVKISKNDFIKTFEKINNIALKMPEKPTYFEILTAIVFDYFSNENCNIAVIETGLGGRLDSTNAIKSPICSIITGISLDHTNILGNSIEKIAIEKCGIIKPKSPVIVSSDQKKNVCTIIKKFAKKINSKIIFCDKKNITKIKMLNEKTFEFNYKHDRFELSLIGDHQIINAHTAIETANFLKNELKLNHQNIFNGIKKSYIPARFEIFTTSSQKIILDGAHNQSGVKSLKKTLTKYFKNTDFIGICGMLKDKDIKNSLNQILPIFKKVFLVEPNSERSMKLPDLADIAQEFNTSVISCQNLQEALNFSTNSENSKYTIVIFGSLYLAGDFYNQILKKHQQKFKRAGMQ